MIKYLLLALVTFSSLNADNMVVLSGSLRKDSLNKKLAKEAAGIAASLGHTVTYFDLGEFQLPLFNEDLEAMKGMPENAKIMKRAFGKADAIIIASPNYNGSMSGALKNMLDWMSRTENGQDDWHVLHGKKVAIMSASNGKSGGAGGLQGLEYVIGKLGGSVAKNQLSLSKAESKFDESGKLSDSHEKGRLTKAIREVTR